MSVVTTTECDGVCPFCMCWRQPVVSMDPELVLKVLHEAPDVGVKIVDFTGGQPPFWEGLKESLILCRKIGLSSSVTTSGPATRAITDYAELVDTLRLSVHGTAETQNAIQGEGYASYLDLFLKEVLPARQSLRTELVFTITPEKSRADFEAVDALARKYRTRVIGNFEHGQHDFTSIENLIREFRRKRWWVVSLSKIRYLKRGGNNPVNPTCGAHRVICLYDNQIVQPCFQHRNAIPSIPLKKGLKNALLSETRLNWESQTGRWDFCDGCTIWCYNLVGLIEKCWRRYAAFLHLPTLLGQGIRDQILSLRERSS